MPFIFTKYGIPSFKANTDCCSTCVTFNARLVLFHVESGERPSVRIQPPLVSVDTGNSIEFHCIATGNPRPSIEWTRSDGQPLPIDSVVEDGVLRIQVVTVEHQGEYQCTALNSLGSSQASATLEVGSGISSQLLRCTSQFRHKITGNWRNRMNVLINKCTVRIS